MNRVGLIKSVSGGVVTILGYGEYVGDEIVYDLDLGIDVTAPKILLDSGTTIVNTDFYMASEESVKIDIANYLSDGYKLVNDVI